MNYYYCSYGCKYYIDDQVVYETVNVPSLISKSQWYALSQHGKNNFINSKLRFQRSVVNNLKLTPLVSELDFWSEYTH